MSFASIPEVASRKNRASRITGLDGLRAFAVLLVLWSHTTTIDLYIGGYQGVLLFFVISGFLITGILLDSRSDVERQETSIRHALQTFYVRRSLRIFPLYYAVLALFLLGSDSVRRAFGWHVTYLSNWYFAKTGVFDRWTAHLWSLAVEEQFYLFWPWFVLLLPKSTLRWTIMGMIVMGPVSRILLGYAGATELALWITTPTALDALGLGCFLAWFSRKSELVHRLALWALIAGLLLLGAHHAMENTGAPRYIVFSVKPLAWALIWMWLVSRVAAGKGGPVLSLLRSRALIYIGTISYGIYLFHMPVMHAVRALQSRLLMWNLWDHSALRFVVVSLITVLLAELSWRCLEQPINRLKNRFPYT
jgi:peptidoglycan/LPS O-acetylase OafA/YrhL